MRMKAPPPRWISLPLRIQCIERLYLIVFFRRDAYHTKETACLKGTLNDLVHPEEGKKTKGISIAFWSYRKKSNVLN